MRYADLITGGLVLALAWLPALAAQGEVTDHQPQACTPAARTDWAAGANQALTNQARVQPADQPVRLMFLGDSITQCWRFARDHKFPGGLDSWNQHFETLGAVNFGIAGDLTEHVLWRITTGRQLANHPRLIVLLIGTNNLHRSPQPDSPAEVAAGIRCILAAIREQSPESKVLLLGLLPREWNPEASRAVAEVNRLLVPCADQRWVFYFDAGPVLLAPEGKISRMIFRDGLHLSPQGYELLAQALLPEIARIQTQP